MNSSHRRARSITPETSSFRSAPPLTNTQLHHYNIYLLPSHLPLQKNLPPSPQNSTIFLFIVNSNSTQSLPIHQSPGILYSLSESEISLNQFNFCKEAGLGINLRSGLLDFGLAVLLGWVEEDLLEGLERILLETSIPRWNGVEGRNYGKEWVLEGARKLEEEGGMLSNAEIIIRHALG